MWGDQAKEAVSAAIETARRAGAAYADARVVTIRNQHILAEDRRIERISDGESCGLGVRVLLAGSWGFAAASDLAPASAESVARRAVAVARASASLRKGPPVCLADEPPHRDRHATPRESDPFEVPVERKVGLLLSLHETILQVPGVAKAHSFLRFRRETKTFANTEGSLLELDILTSACGIRATAVGAGDAQMRKYEPPPLNGGYEVIERADLAAHARRVGAEAVEKLHAPVCPEGPADLILLPSHLFLTIHESVGHATELDRVLGMEESLSGGSFATLDRLGTLRYGSPLVNFRALNLRPGLLASTGYDDDGVACQDWDIVRDGILVGYSTNRETAPAIGASRSCGSCHADSWDRIPILRMPNVCLLPGCDRLSLADLIADTREGILIDGDGSFSIDQKRLNFQFGGDAFWLIRNGKLAGMVRDLTYQAITPEFWNSCDAICDETEWQPYGTQNCGKGDPMQIYQMTQGSAPARFRKVNVRRAECR